MYSKIRGASVDMERLSCKLDLQRAGPIYNICTVTHGTFQRLKSVAIAYTKEKLCALFSVFIIVLTDTLSQTNKINFKLYNLANITINFAP